MEADTGALPAPEDEAEWSRAWEWPDWLRTGGGGLRGWRPDGRTLVAVLALVEGTLLAGLLPDVQQLWRATFPPAPNAFGLFDSSRFNWERLITGTELGEVLAALVVIAGAIVVAVLPRRVPGYVVVLLGLGLRLAAAGAIAVAEFHLDPPTSGRIGLIASCLLILLLIALTLLTAARRPRPAPSD